MNTNVDYSNYKVDSNQRTYYRRKSPMLAVLLIIAAFVTVGVTIYMAFPPKSSQITVPPSTIYCVSLNRFTTIVDANAFATQVIDSGGSGYVFNSNGYHVIAASYTTASDADKVLTNISAQYANASIIAMPRIETVHKDIDKADITTATRIAACNQIFVATNLIGISVSLDKLEITSEVALLQVQQLINTVNDNIVLANLLTDSSLKTNSINFLTQAKTILMQMVDTTLTPTSSLSSRIKYKTIEIYNI